MSDAREIDYLEFARQRSVPFLELLDVRPLLAADGKSAFEMTVQQRHLRTLGMVHGGVTASLLDTAVGMAAITVAPPGHHVVTVQLNVNFTRMISEGETLTTTAEVQHRGSRTAVVFGEMRTADNKLAATASATLMYVPIPEDANLPTGFVQEELRAKS